MCEFIRRRRLKAGDLKSATVSLLIEPPNKIDFSISCCYDGRAILIAGGCRARPFNKKRDKANDEHHENDKNNEVA